MTDYQQASLVDHVLDAAFGGGKHLRYAHGDFYHFTGTHWTVLSEPELGRMLLPHIAADPVLRTQRRTAGVREVTGTLRAATAVADFADQSSSASTPIINVRNGELRFSADGSFELRPHDPASNQLACLQIDYDPEATCPVYDRAIAAIFSRLPDGPAVERQWDEVCGYTMQPLRPIPVIAVGWGKGGDGKSSLARVLTQILGHEQVAAMSVEDLKESRFTLSELRGKRLFLDGDVAAGAHLPDGRLKKMSEGSLASGERKNREAVAFRLGAVPMLLGNNVPHLADCSPGLKRRLMVLPCNRQFSEAEVDPTLFPYIIEVEMAGVLNRMLRGLQQVIRRGWRFDQPASIKAATDRWWAEATGAQAELHLPARPQTQVLPTRLADGPEPVAAVRRRPDDQVIVPGVPSVAVDVDAPAFGGGYAVKVRAGETTIAINVRGRSEHDNTPHG